MFFSGSGLACRPAVGERRRVPGCQRRAWYWHSAAQRHPWLPTSQLPHSGPRHRLTHAVPLRALRVSYNQLLPPAVASLSLKAPDAARLRSSARLLLAPTRPKARGPPKAPDEGLKAQTRRVLSSSRVVSPSPCPARPSAIIPSSPRTRLCPDPRRRRAPWEARPCAACPPTASSTTWT